MVVPTSNNNTRKNNNNNPSFSAVGWVTLLISLSGAHAFNSPGRNALATVRTPGSLASGDGTSFITYDRRRTNDDVVFSRRSPSRRTRRVSTRLQYRDSNEDPGTANSTVDSPVFGKWLDGLFASRTAHCDDSQEHVDEYLEFLNRRYNRLHSDEQEAEKKTFSALGWLLQGESDSKPVATQRQQADSFYVLGVAGLASEKLLQKHHQHSLHQRQQKSAEVATVARPVWEEPSTIVDATVESKYTSKIKAQVVPIVRGLRLMERRRQLFIRSQHQKLRVFLAVFVKTVARSLIHGPVRTTKAVLEFGGGKKNMALTLTVASATLLLLRPILRAVVTEGSVGA